MNIEIHKVELKSGIFLAYDYTMNDADCTTKIKASADRVIHQDLEDAMNGLVPHFLMATEMKKKPELAKVIDLKQISEELLSGYRVKCVTIHDNKGDLSYEISGLKFLKTGKSIAFSTPKIPENAPHEDLKYDFIDQLVDQVEIIKDEVLEYIDGKAGVKAQKEIEFQDGFEPETDTIDEGKFEETAA